MLISEAVNYLEKHQTEFEERKTPGTKQMLCSQHEEGKEMKELNFLTNLLNWGLYFGRKS